MEEIPRRRFREGFLYGLGAFTWWGLVPLYFKSVKELSPAELLAHRIVWSVAFLSVILTLSKRWLDFVRCFRELAVLRSLFCSTALIAFNWYVYLYSVIENQLVQSSLGYYLLPLVSVVFGLLFFKERLRPLQWIALTLASVGVFLLVQANGEWPWIALALAFSFGTYGLVRKQAPVDGLIGLSVEVALLLPVSVLYLLYLSGVGDAKFGSLDRWFDGLVLLSGVVTAVPLLFFGQAARKLPLSTLGFLQYLSPTIALVLAVLLYNEPFEEEHLKSFACIWLALTIFSVDTLHEFRRSARPAPAEIDASRAACGLADSQR